MTWGYAMLMLDLFAGLGGASAAFRRGGWDVVTVDNDPAFGCTQTADLSGWEWCGPRPDLIWASPPCQEFARESMPWCRTGRRPSMELVTAAVRIVRECQPAWWVIENVRGARRFFRPTLGEPRAVFFPYYLWGDFPAFGCTIYKRPKESYSGRNRAERARVPYTLSFALKRACEEAAAQKSGG